MGGVGVLVAGVGVLLTKKPADLLRNLRPGFLVILRLLHIKGILSNHFLTIISKEQQQHNNAAEC